LSNRFLTAAWKAETKHPSHKLVLARLADSANEDGEAWPKVATVARDTGLSHRQVIRVTHDLESAGLIRIQKRRDRYRENTYHLCAAKLGLPHDRVTRDTVSDDTLASPQLPPATLSRDTVSKPPAPPYRKNHQEPTYEPTAAGIAEEIGKIVETEPSLRTEQVMQALATAIKGELRNGSTLEHLASRLLAGWRQYSTARDRGKFDIRGWGPARFFVEGHWKDEQTWPWKPEHRPEPKRRYVDPTRLYDGPEYQPAARALSHDAANTAVFSPLKSPQISQTQKASI
jgi:hypothetical protein